jgi:hypothetical protein
MGTAMANSNQRAPKKTSKAKTSRGLDNHKAEKPLDEPQKPEAKPVGRPSDFDEAYVKQVEKLCHLGATDEEIAEFFGVSTRTIYRWKLDHDEFCQAIKLGKEAADNRVERSLYQKATGYFFTEQQAFKLKIDQYKEEVEVVDVEKFQPADTTAQIFWLKNRRKDDWRDKQDHEHGLTGDMQSFLAQIGAQPRLARGND